MKKQLSNKIERLLQKATKLQDDFEETSNKLRKVIQPLCDFDVEVTFCSGDGVLMLDEEDSNVGTFDSLIGKTKTNKLTKDEFFKYTL